VAIAKFRLPGGVEAEVESNLLGAEVELEGGSSDKACLGWALVIADLLAGQGIDGPHLTATDDQAVLSLNGRGVYEALLACVTVVAKERLS
jgi:hypothetical protein